MRNVNLIDPIPTREALRERIANPGRFRPEPRMLLDPELRMREDGTGDVYLPAKDKWKQIHAIQIAALHALRAGKTVAEAIEAAKPACPPGHAKYAEKYVRRFVWKLHRGGVLDLPLAPPPDVFAGRYRRIKEIGRGGMGVVHLCADEEREGKLVVVKHAWGWTMSIERAELGTREEAHALSRFDHPRIPALTDLFEVDGLLHMVREWAPGEGMNAYVPKGAFSSSTTRLALLRECARILAHVHARGWLYMDLKPDNFVMESVEAGPYLLDMGLCRPLVDGVVKLRGPIGSPGFVAPEVLKERHATVRSDVFGLARIFVQLATGKPIRPKHKEQEVAALLADAKVEGDERDLLVRMCADDPARRPPHMAAVIDAIP